MCHSGSKNLSPPHPRTPGADGADQAVGPTHCLVSNDLASVVIPALSNDDALGSAFALDYIDEPMLAGDPA